MPFLGQSTQCHSLSALQAGLSLYSYCYWLSWPDASFEATSNGIICLISFSVIGTKEPYFYVGFVS